MYNTIIYKVVDSSKTYVNKEGITKPSVNYCLIGYDGKYISIKLDKFNYSMLQHFQVVECSPVDFLGQCNNVQRRFEEALKNAYKQ